jgi:hypothetical protein
MCSSFNICSVDPEGAVLSHFGSVFPPRYVPQYTLHTKLSSRTCDSLCWPTLLEYINYTPWRWPFKDWNML